MTVQSVLLQLVEKQVSLLLTTWLFGFLSVNLAFDIFKTALFARCVPSPLEAPWCLKVLWCLLRGAKLLTDNDHTAINRASVMIILFMKGSLQYRKLSIHRSHPMFVSERGRGRTLQNAHPGCYMQRNLPQIPPYVCMLTVVDIHALLSIEYSWLASSKIHKKIEYFLLWARNLHRTTPLLHAYVAVVLLTPSSCSLTGFNQQYQTH